MLADRVRMRSGSLLNERYMYIDSSKIDQTLYNYPIMVKLQNSDIDFNLMRNDGLDIKFIGSNNQPLDFEVEYFNKSQELGIYHVRVPTVSSSVNTMLSCIYGFGTDIDYSNKYGVWDNNFAMVQHMGNDLQDSTANANNGVNFNTSIVNGIYGFARKFSGEGYIDFGNKTSLYLPTANGMTISIVFKADKYTSNWATLIAKEKWSSNDGWLLTKSNGLGITFSKSGSETGLRAPLPPEGAWSMLTVFQNNSGTSKIFNNGVEVQSGTIRIINLNSINLYVGNRHANTSNSAGHDYWIGAIKEVRLSKTPRSNAWVKADYHNLMVDDLIVLVD